MSGEHAVMAAHPPRAAATDAATTQTLPASWCYWAILHAPARALRRTGQLPMGLLGELAAELPIDLGDVHVVATPIDAVASDGQQRILICAFPRDMLESVSQSVLTLCPETIPTELDIAHVDPSTLNFLVGEFRPKPLIAAQRSRHLRWAATFLLCAVLGAVGLSRRTIHLREHAAAASQRADTLLAQWTPDRREQTLSDLLARARETSALIVRATPPRDAANDLAAVLTSWPVESKDARPQSLSVTPEGVTLAVTVEGDAAAFLKAFTPPPAFALEEPRLVKVGSLTRLNLRLRPEKNAAQAGGRP